MSILFACLIFNVVYSQEQNVQLGNLIQQQLENLTEQQESETEDDSFLQYLVQLHKNPININAADEADLKELRMLSDLQIQNLSTYKKLLGNLINIYELQSVPGWDLATIQKILPYVRVANAMSIKESLKQRFTGGENTILLRMQQQLEASDGYKRPDSITNRYAGSPQRMYFRYKYTYRNLLQFGLTGDKDAGEQFFAGKQKAGFDFYSFHLFARKLGKVKLLALGDFTVNLGQGLTHWQSLAFKKSVDVTAVKRQADIIRPYNSASEYNFQRGAGITIGGKKVDITAFASVRKLDATYNADTSLSNEDYISSILTSGYHRSQSEVAKKNSFTQTTFGGNVSYKTGALHVGLNAVHYRFSVPLQRDIAAYNQFAVQGTGWSNYSFDYSYTFKNVHWFGEAAIDHRGAKAFVGGLISSLAANVDLSLVYRNISKKYQALYGNAFTESTLPTNEKGLFTGISIRPTALFKIDAYADVFSFPWLRYRTDAPTSGSEFLVQLTYQPNKRVELYTRFRNENKAINLPGLDLPMRPVVTRPKQNWRTQFSYAASKEVTVRTRVEMVWYDIHEKDRSQQGFLTYLEGRYKPLGKAYAVNTRLQYFETDDFESRLYAFESDVLYSFSIPQFSGKGFRYYVNFNYDISKKLTGWFRWAQTIYAGTNFIGSGIDKINGNKRSDIKMQLQYSF